MRRIVNVLQKKRIKKKNVLVDGVNVNKFVVGDLIHCRSYNITGELVMLEVVKQTDLRGYTIDHLDGVLKVSWAEHLGSRRISFHTPKEYLKTPGAFNYVIEELLRTGKLKEKDVFIWVDDIFLRDATNDSLEIKSLEIKRELGL